MSQIRKGTHGVWVCALGLLAAILLSEACSQKSGAPAGSEDPMLRDRQERDRAFRSNPGSPIPAEDRARFQKLDYFPLNSGLRFHLKLHRYAAPERIRLATNTGEVREGLRYGYFEFSVASETCRLQVYRLDENENPGQPYLFIPFRDATSGKDTYAAGRYLDLQENTSGTYDLDFNRAYNPSCAYGGDFSCPTPPAENHLKVPITAGEKKYPLARDH
jgi:uncharacterized protein